MPRFPLGGPALVALALIFTLTQAGLTDAPKDKARPSAEAVLVIKAHPIDDLGVDSDLSANHSGFPPRIISEMIVQMIEPESWHDNRGATAAFPGTTSSNAGGLGQGKISYFPPGRALIVSNTPEVHAKVEAFLNELRRTKPARKETAAAQVAAPIVPAQALAPVQEPGVSAPLPYAISMQTNQQPKHRFIIRYEGEGFIDSNVVEFMKTLSGGTETPPSPTPPAGAPAGAVPPYSTPQSCPAPNSEVAPVSAIRPAPSFAAAAEPGVVPFGNVTVNLAEDKLNRYLRMNILLVVDEASTKETNELLTKRKAHLKNWLISYLSDQSLADVGRAAGVNRIRREIREQFNAMLAEDGSERIREILFDEFNVQ